MYPCTFIERPPKVCIASLAQCLPRVRIFPLHDSKRIQPRLNIVPFTMFLYFHATLPACWPWRCHRWSPSYPEQPEQYRAHSTKVCATYSIVTQSYSFNNSDSLAPCGNASRPDQRILRHIHPPQLEGFWCSSFW
jgi:hypothetical protein